MTLKEFIDSHNEINYWNVFLFVEDEWESKWEEVNYLDYLDCDDFDYFIDAMKKSCDVFLN